MSWAVSGQSLAQNGRESGHLSCAEFLAEQIGELDRRCRRRLVQPSDVLAVDARPSRLFFGTTHRFDEQLGRPRSIGRRKSGDESLEHILAWVQASTEQIPGLRVSSIDIKPTNTTWTVQVVMYRYERFE